MSRSLIAALVLCALSCGSFAHAKKRPTSGAPPEEVTLFEAIKDKKIDVLVVPRNARRLTVTIRNRTKKPLRIAMPKALAAVPVHRQVGGFDQGNFGGGAQAGLQGGGGQQGGGSQGLGFGGGGQGQGLGGGQGAGNGLGGGQQFGRRRGRRNQGMGGGLFNVLPNKKISKRYRCVCLEQGKKDPSTRMKYKVVPLKHFSTDPTLVELLDLLNKKKVKQAVAQAATWNITNKLNWQQLVGLNRRYLNGATTPYFRAADVFAAKRLLGRLGSQPKSKRRSLANR